MPYVIKPHWDGDGLVVEGVGGEALDKYDLVYLKGAKWYKADLDTEATMPGRGMALSDLPLNYKGRILLYGLVRNTAWTWVDGPIYASSTAGGLTQSAPAGTTGWVQSVGDAHGSDYILFAPTWIKELGVTYTKHEHIDLGLFKIPAAATPNIVTQDNAVIFFFNQNDTEYIYLRWPKGATNYASGDLKIVVHWTNDGGADDNGKNVRWEINYQTVALGGSIAGNHANSPKTIDDTYTSDTGHLEHTSPAATIAAADFATAHGIIMKFTAIVPAVTALTGEAGLLGVALEYEAYVEPT